MNEGLQINLSMNGVQQALGSISQIQQSVTAMSKSMNMLARFNAASIVASSASSVVSTVKEIGYALANFAAEFEAIKDSMTSNDPITGLLNNLTAMGKAVASFADREENSLRKEITLRGYQLEIEMEILKARQFGDQLRADMDAKKIGLDPGFKALRVNAEGISNLEIELLDTQIAAIEERSEKAMSEIDHLKLRKELQELYAKREIILQEEHAKTWKSIDDQRQAMRDRDRDALELSLVMEDRLLKLKQDQFDVDRATVQANFRLTDIEKREKMLALLIKERDAIKEQVALLQRRQDVLDSQDTTGRELLQGRIDNTARRGLDVGQQIAGIEGAPDPESFRDQFANVFTELQNQWGGWAQQMATSFKNVFETSISSISSGITGLIMGTQTWAQALRSIGSTVLTTVIQSIVQMGVRWVATRLMMSAVEKTASAGDALAKAPSAIMTSISSWGLAAAVGLAAVIAAVAAFGGFERGGYTGDGHPASIAGVVHRGEYVIPAPAVDRMGVQGIESMLSGGGAGGSQNIAFFDDGSRLADWARTQEGETVIVDVVRRNLHKFGQA